MTEPTYGTGGWTLDQLQLEFDPPEIPPDATPSDLKHIDSRCAILVTKIIREKKLAERNLMGAKKKWERTRKEIHIALAQANRRNSRDQRKTASELDDESDIYKGNYNTPEGEVFIDIPYLQDIYDNIEYEVELWLDLLSAVKMTAKQAENMAFNNSIEGKYGGSVAPPNPAMMQEKPWIKKVPIDDRGEA